MKRKVSAQQAGVLGSLAGLLVALSAVSAAPTLWASEAPPPADAEPSSSEAKQDSTTESTDPTISPPAEGAASTETERPSSPCAPKKKKKRASPCAVGG